MIHVESSTRQDTLRTLPPYKDGVPGPDRTAYFANYNCNKYGISLNLAKPQAVEIIKRLVRWADVVVESFTPGVMKRYGLDYEQLIKIKPDIIMASTCIMGQTGPYASYRGYGTHGASLAGYREITGYPDGLPIGPYGAYTDIIAYRFLIIAILRALDYRRKTGKGQYIDQSQVESSLHFLAPAFLDYTVNGRVATRNGNRNPYAAPHGAYRCLGDDRWCVIAVTTDEEWKAFCRVIGNPRWTQSSEFSTLLERKKNGAELDNLVENWTVNHSVEEVMTLMQEAGVPAGVVEKAEDVHRDPQLKHRHHFWVLNHSVIGLHAYDSAGFRLSKTPGEPRFAAPCLGEHNEYVYKEILGMSDDEIGDLVAEGVLE